MAEVRYLSVLEVEALHAFILEKTGDQPALLRDRSLLESAVMRPRNAAFYSNCDLVEQSALLAVAISQSQAFVDGNKRTAFIVADVFLRCNGLFFSGDPLDLAEQIEACAAHESGEREATERFAEWLRPHVTSPAD